MSKTLPLAERKLDQLLLDPGGLTCGRPYIAVLMDAYNLISNPKHWTQGVHARNASGEPVKPTDPSACCWCYLGALAKVCNPHGIIPPPLLYFLEEVREQLYGDRHASVGALNDYVSHAELAHFLGLAHGYLAQHDFQH